MEKAEILIYGCHILPMNGKDPIEDGVIAVKNGRIIHVGKKSATTKIKASTKIDAKGKAALPGLINLHTHVAMTLFRGMAEDLPLKKWLERIIWPLEAKLKPEDVYDGALLGCLEMMKSGTTCFADMYFHENMVAEAVQKSGLRGVLAEGIIEAGNKKQGEKMLKNSVHFTRKFDGYAEGRITAFLGPHATYSCSPELLHNICEKASDLDVGIHMHLAESEEMSEEFEKKYGSSEVEFLDKQGLLKRHVLAAHCINLSRKDMKILSERSVNVAYVPVSNMKLGSGAPRINELVGLGVNVGLGTDGPASNNTLDMFETMKTATLLQKLIYLDPEVLPAHKVLRMATINAAEALKLKEEIGSLEVGKKADIILVDISKPHLTPLHNIYACIVYSARGSDVDTVIVDGKIIMENRQVKTLEEKTAIEKAEKTTLDLLSR